MKHATLWLTILLTSLGAATVAEPTTYLLVDDTFLARTENVTRHTHACTKLDTPVLEAEAPWEQDGIDQRVYLYGTVRRDEGSGQFRMWYNRLNDVLYATSEDGVHWTRPDLGLFEYEGSTANNIVWKGLHSPSVVCNAAAAPANRYVMLGYTRKPERGCYAAHSSDGIHWALYPENPVVLGGDTCTLAYDPDSATYFAYAKRTEEYRGHERRIVYAAKSPNMQEWTEPVLALAPDATDDAITEAEGGQYSEFYNLSVYPRGGYFLGLATHFRYVGEPKVKGPAQSNDDGPIDVQLAFSHDGLAWQRPADRTPLIPNGPHAYDQGCILGVANSPVFVDDEMWLYYTAITTTHGGCLPDKRISIALAKWRRDGFVSLDAGATPGLIETVPLACDGAPLRINANASDGHLTVAVFDDKGDALPGYSHEACTPITTDGVELPVTWGAQKILPVVGPIRLQFHLRDARLYSFSTGR